MKDSHEFKICLYLKEINSIINNRINQKIKERGLTQSQITAIKLVAHFKRLTLTELSEYMSIKKSTCSGIVDRLENMEVFERVKDEDDKRVTYIVFSKKGQILSNDIKEDINGSFKEVFNGISKDDLILIETNLEKLINKIDK
ncbi:MarR family transcriptional regulator [Clostridium sp. Ade.TY]|uniref:MarR family winged helix-turn-helix transcriptional regulator n=1 Tax=Clostridium sp. Ade.TY TaxID=1391647 RepID=UPI0004272B23|nr:MarR family transcriptional regulator [Clostridium sp. Ade.TY]